VAYHNGEGVPKDKDQTENWLGKASQQGDAIGSFYLGQLYVDKRFLGRPDALSALVAADRFALSAKQGYSVAAFKLGQLYSSRGSPLRRDEPLACMWYLVASSLAEEGAWEVRQPDHAQAMRRELPRRIDQVRKSFGPARYAACEQRAAEWIAAHPPDHQFPLYSLSLW
jgi:TPR repeat protein